MAPAGLEPTAYGLGNRRSIHLSYGAEPLCGGVYHGARAAPSRTRAPGPRRRPERRSWQKKFIAGGQVVQPVPKPLQEPGGTAILIGPQHKNGKRHFAKVGDSVALSARVLLDRDHAEPEGSVAIAGNERLQHKVRKLQKTPTGRAKLRERVAVEHDSHTSATGRDAALATAASARTSSFSPGSSSMASVAHFMCELVTRPETGAEWRGKLPVVTDAGAELRAPAA